MDAMTNSGVEIGIDTGGTFTDVVCVRDGRLIGTAKVPSTPSDPSLAILDAVNHVEQTWGISLDAIARFAHGTTVATNAVIERKGGCVGLLTTAGFSDVIEIGRQLRRQLYEVALTPQTPVFLAPGRRRKGVSERVTSDGSILVPLDEASVRSAVKALIANGAEVIAISFLFSFLNPSHERRARDIVAEEFPDLKISISSDVDPTFREYERTVVTAFDAYLKPVVDSYLARLQTKLTRAGVPNEPMIMQSRGGMSAVSMARQRPVRLFLSGPAAGVVGAATVGRAVGEENLISVDIGGTSSDIALISNGQPALRSEGEIDGYPVRVNMVDINAIGAGGGSLVWFDTAGGLRVGPGSAGANPGPACYDRGGDQATVTDASVVLGFIDPDYFAGGSVVLNQEKALDVIEKTVAAPLKNEAGRAAQGIHRVINAQMAEGIRLVSIQRGYDPRHFTLIALGGAGPVHATALADELAIRKVIIPRHPGVLSAMGLLVAPIEHETTLSVQRNLADLNRAEVTAILDDLGDQCSSLMAAEGVAPSDADIHHLADICYVGQSHHLEVPVHTDHPDPLERLYQDFKGEHDRIHGHAMNTPARIVNLRTLYRYDRQEAFQSDALTADASESLKGHRSVLFTDAAAPESVEIHDRDRMGVDARVAGPAIIEQADTTTVVSAGWQASVHASGNLMLEKNTIS